MHFLASVYFRVNFDRRRRRGAYELSRFTISPLIFRDFTPDTKVLMPDASVSLATPMHLLFMAKLF